MPSTPTSWRSALAAGTVLALSATGALAQPFTPGGWQQISAPASLTVDGKTYAPSCSGFPGTDPTFSFWARRGSSSNTVVVFEGGGACWDNLTCTFPIAGLPPQVPQFFVPQVPPGANPALYDGIFRADPANPVKDWNMVYVPYCTGDLHAGSATRTYTSVGNPALGIQAGLPLTIQHRGFDNFMAVLDWMKTSLPTPRQLFVTGPSAGGYGATFNAPWLQKAYPTAQLSVLADASQGVSTAAWDAGTPGRGSWNLQAEPGVFGDLATIRGNDVARRLAVGLPRAKVAQFTTTFDTVQIGFYGVMKQFYSPGGACPDPAVDWYQQMSTKLVTDGASTPNFRYYVAGGTYHTLLRSPQFYSEASAGPVFSDWLRNMLASRGGTGGSGGRWNSVACPGCLVDVNCP
jgi:hypothetical protein